MTNVECRMRNVESGTGAMGLSCDELRPWDSSFVICHLSFFIPHA